MIDADYKKGLRVGLFALCSLILVISVGASVSRAQLNENCVVSILNRTVSVNPDGTWVLPNIPANFGPVRARATCVNNGVTTFGQSNLFTIAANGSANVPPIVLGVTTPIPVSLSVNGPNTSLTQAGATEQLTVTGAYADGSTQDLSAATAGTQYLSSNSSIATVSANGLVTAVSSGTVVIQAIYEGRQGIVSIPVVLAGASHGGIPDSWAIAHGLDPNDPAMPFEDPDHDGLTNLQEFQNGTDPHNPDTDGDGLTDGQEVLVYHTNPVLFSTDGTGIPDGLEVQEGTVGATLAQKLAKALSSLTVTPSNFALTVNTISGVASQQLKVTGLLADGRTKIDLTSTTEGTTYSSSDLTICNFGSPDGDVFAGNNGSCVITVANGSLSVKATAFVNSFSPTPLSFVSIPGFANGVAVNGNYAYVAAGGSGLQVVNVSDRTNPTIVGSLALSGNANDVKLVGTLAYVASGSSGLQVVDVTNPASPLLVGTLDTKGTALDVSVVGTTAYIANQTNFVIADVTTPSAMSLVGTLPLLGLIQGLDIDPQRRLAVVAAGTTGIYVVDVSNPTKPAMLGSTVTGDARDVAIKGNYAFVADFTTSTTSVDITNPSTPVVLSNITDPNLGGFLQDIALSGNFALAADVKFFNGIPLTDISNPNNLIARDILKFTQRDDNGMGIAADGSYVYLATEHSAITKFGTTGDSRLYIGQYLALVDNKGIPPTASIVSPTDGGTVVAGSTLPILVNATDDVAVAAVNFLVNGQVVFTATSSPYRFNYKVPTGISKLALGATAVDFGGNIGNSQTVNLSVISDPGTTVSGTTVDSSLNPVVGATVTCLGISATSGAQGAFSIAGIPTAQGLIQCRASATASNGTRISGRSGFVVPVVKGTTNIGELVLVSSGSSGSDFWFAIQPNYGINYDADVKVIIVSQTTANYTVTLGGGAISGQVTSQTPAIVDLGGGLTVLGAQTVQNNGIHLVTTAPVSATVTYGNYSTSESYLAIPTSSLGSQYYAVGYTGLGDLSSAPSLFILIGTQSNTVVTFVPTCNSSVSAAGTTIQINLGAGQTYGYFCYGEQDITGSQISSTAPVGVISGAACANIPPSNAYCNQLAEMMFPVATLYDTQFYTAPLPGSGFDLYRILASQDNTVVTVVEGGSTTTYNLNHGKFQELQFKAGAMISSNNPISVVQYSVGETISGIGDPFEMQIVPVSHWQTTHKFNTPLDPYFAFSPNYAVITAPAAAVGTVTLNGSAVTGFIALPGGQYEYAVVPVPSGQNIVTSSQPIAVYSIGYGLNLCCGGPASYGAPVTF